MTELLSDTENILRRDDQRVEPRWVATVVWSLLEWGRRQSAERVADIRSYGKRGDPTTLGLLAAVEAIAIEYGGSIVEEGGRAHGGFFDPDGRLVRFEHEYVGLDEHAAERRLMDRHRERFPDGDLGDEQFIVTVGDKDVSYYANFLDSTDGIWAVVPAHLRHRLLAWFGTPGAPGHFHRIPRSRAAAINEIVDEFLISAWAHAVASSLDDVQAWADLSFEERLERRRAAREHTRVAARQRHRGGRRDEAGMTDQSAPPSLGLSSLLDHIAAIDWVALAAVSPESGRWAEAWPSAELAELGRSILAEPRFRAAVDPVGARAATLGAEDGSDAAARVLYGGAVILAIARGLSSLRPSHAIRSVAPDGLREVLAAVAPLMPDAPQIAKTDDPVESA